MSGSRDDGLDDEELDDDGGSLFEAEPREMHDGIEITGYYFGEPIPNLGALPQDRWREVLRPLSPRARSQSKASVRRVADADVAGILVADLNLEDADVVARAERATTARMPAGDPPARGGRHQVSFRLGASEYARLLDAAKLFAMRPTTLARVLTVRGVERALYEERRDR